MNMNVGMKVLLAGVIPMLAVVGCAHPSEVKKDTAPTSSSSASAGNGGNGGGGGGNASPSACKSDLDCGAAQLCVHDRCENITAGMAECSNLHAHFLWNSSQLDPADRASLDRGARCLKADQALHLTIEGNADERGTEEYNMALGDRRATSAASYLEELGVSKAQLKTVSYGKENPLCTEHDEACWSKNRRADMHMADKK